MDSGRSRLVYLCYEDLYLGKHESHREFGFPSGDRSERVALDGYPAPVAIA